MDNLEALRETAFTKVLSWWVNYTLGMAFTYEGAKDADHGWLHREIGCSAATGQFNFYFGPGEIMDSERCQPILDGVTSSEHLSIKMLRVQTPEKVEIRFT